MARCDYLSRDLLSNDWLGHEPLHISRRNARRQNENPQLPMSPKGWIVREIVCAGRAIEQVRLDPKGYKPTNKPRLNSLAPVCCQERASRHGEGGDMALVIRSCEERKGVQSKRLYS